eukprot:2058199-Pleurochrysis_carterae.AAC.1
MRVFKARAEYIWRARPKPTISRASCAGDHQARDPDGHPAHLHAGQGPQAHPQRPGGGANKAWNPRLGP